MSSNKDHQAQVSRISYEDLADLVPFVAASGVELEAGLADELSIDVAHSTEADDPAADDLLDEEARIDLSPGSAERSDDPVRVYLREMAVVPLLSREGEIAVARRIERGHQRIVKAVSRSPICIEELIRIGEDLKRGRAQIRDLVSFSDLDDVTEESIAEYCDATLEQL
ncbi:MAG TPA: sigma-70 factor domain-containing protein, partial [Blastocatellia bacterium]|nr:sigma-70 factor domain-containing protein [Blastocatellia bacterium]